MSALPAVNHLPHDDGIMTARFLVLGSLIAALPFATPVCAAAQGRAGATSKGEIVITVSVAARVALSDAKSATGTGGDGQSACLWLGTATRGYAVTALGAPILWRSSATSVAARTVAPEATLAHLSSAATRPDCGKDATLFVGYEAAGAAAHPATLLIAPE